MFLPPESSINTQIGTTTWYFQETRRLRSHKDNWQAAEHMTQGAPRCVNTRLIG